MHFWMMLLRLVHAIQEGHDLGAGAGLIRAERRLARPVGDALLHSPGDGGVVIGVRGHVLEAAARHGGGSGQTIQEGHRMGAGAGLVGAEGRLARSLGDAVLHRPQDGLGVVGILCHVRKGHLRRLGCRAADRAPQERHDLATGADPVRGKHAV